MAKKEILHDAMFPGLRIAHETVHLVGPLVVMRCETTPIFGCSDACFAASTHPLKS